MKQLFVAIFSFFLTFNLKAQKGYDFKNIFNEVVAERITKTNEINKVEQILKDKKITAKKFKLTDDFYSIKLNKGMQENEVAKQDNMLVINTYNATFFNELLIKYKAQATEKIETDGMVTYTFMKGKFEYTILKGIGEENKKPHYQISILLKD